MLSINCKGQLIHFDVPRIMGIINTTPDSFYKHSRQATIDSVLHTAETMLRDGASFLDLGGQSTRPGSERVSEVEEADRVLPAIEAVAKHFPKAILSVDTFYASVAKAAIGAGAAMVNDVSAGTLDPKLIATVTALRVPYVLMHMKGDPQTMQQAPAYANVALEVYDQLNFKIRELTDWGIKDIIVDPGFGFGKTAAHNFQLLRELSFFQKLGKPVLAGISRKATIYKTLGVTAQEALNGTTVLNTVALLNGAQLLRVHDVKEAVEAVRLIACIRK